MNTVLTSGPNADGHMTRTILVVDDETTLRETLVEALELEGYRAIPAADGREALIRFRADQPDLVLLDLMLPELSGRRGLPDPARGVTGPDHHAHRPRRRGGQGRRAGARRGRLRDQALQPARAHRPDPRDLPPRRAARRDAGPAAARGRGPRPGGPRRAPRPARRPGGPHQAQGVRAARVPRAQSGPGLHEGPAPGEGLGLRLRRRVPDGGRPRPLAARGAGAGPGQRRELLQTVRGVGYVFRRPGA